MTDHPPIHVAYDPQEVLLWRTAAPVGQRVVRLHASGPALLRALSEEGCKPTELRGVWLARSGFEAMLAQALLDPDPVTLGRAGDGCLDKALLAQHRLATRFAQVRVVLDEELDGCGQPTGRLAPCFSLRAAARHALPGWTVREQAVDVRAWPTDGLDKALRASPYPVEPAVWCGWTRA